MLPTERGALPRCSGLTMRPAYLHSGIVRSRRRLASWSATTTNKSEVVVSIATVARYGIRDFAFSGPEAAHVLSSCTRRQWQVPNSQNIGYPSSTLESAFAPPP